MRTLFFAKLGFMELLCLPPGEAFAPYGRCRPNGATISKSQQLDKLKFDFLIHA